MDKSDEYILMCTETKKYLQPHEAISGDWYADDCNGLHTLAIYDFLPSEGKTHAEICETEYVWLPLQDQLQEMITPDLFDWETIDDINKLDMFYEFIKSECRPIEFSFEKMWLLFVMKIKFNKTWDGNTWI